MRTDVFGGRPFPNCPYPGSALPANGTSVDFQYHNPSISTFHLLLGVICISWTITTTIRYNRVKIFNREIVHPSITSREYIWSFGFLSFAFLLDALRYAFNLPFEEDNQILSKYMVGPDIMDAWLIYLSGTLRSLSLLMLSLALVRQHTYRSAAPTLNHFANNDQEANERSRLLSLSNLTEGLTVGTFPNSRNGLFMSPSPVTPEPNDVEPSDNRNFIASILDNGMELVQNRKLIAVLAWSLRNALQLVFVDKNRFVEHTQMGFSHKILPIGSLLFGIIQILPMFELVYLIVFTNAIIFNPETQHHERSRTSVLTLFNKLKLVIGSLLTCVFWLEPSVIHSFLHVFVHNSDISDICIVPPWWWIDNPTNLTEDLQVHGWASYMDLLLYFGGFGLSLVFSFMKSEFKRNREDWIWITVSEVQNTFDFRRY